MGYNALLDEADKGAVLRLLATLLTPEGSLSLAERVPRRTQRIYRLVDATGIDGDLWRRWQEAEEAIYAWGQDVLVNWDEGDLVQAAQAAGLAVESSREVTPTPTLVTVSQVERWFALGGDRPGYAGHLAAQLDEAEIAQVRALLLRQVAGQTVAWESTTVFLRGRHAATKGRP